ncbi:TadE/TadG family type IV pilus assembly protein [Rhizobium sp. C1]|uniref:TadE/TadG family type IV pilus assembly protein n=1 Tax=Rhizobium sp. C1 TaxID=1349799 RepID=UPI001E2DFFF6|nr:TadE/TadG family type IV pilus assembly protein [Rhizobium sp. C1]MCD2177664.1 pilus assembly protein [Rhizobium sp. C1]
MIRRLRSASSAFRRNRQGAAAVEFALLVLPFFTIIFVILQISLMFFIETGLDGALIKSARKVRTGYATTNGWTISNFKNDLCANLALSFSCSSQLLVVAVVITDMSSVPNNPPTTNGVLTVTEQYTTGKSGDYVLIHAYLPWKPILPMYNFAGAQLKDGTYILGAASLFRNEPS